MLILMYSFSQGKLQETSVTEWMMVNMSQISRMKTATGQRQANVWKNHKPSEVAWINSWPFVT